ncbi:uncharacterized protein RSE6_09999 [Rhynchosporium secalis]|uniref:Uncharacterized protein n=1 Tax=Rhynchosporium secalis TaxID=38038 RepID=A0A1E1MJB6_RHYSE|nr:uncharacterized protein RSE6_09999 [Rhynchosporium secalis]
MALNKLLTTCFIIILQDERLGTNRENHRAFLDNPEPRKLSLTIDY